MGLVFCGLAFVAALLFTRRSLFAGVNAVLATGYMFGIVRAHFPDTYSHFIFDSAVLGLYFSVFAKNWPRPENESQRALYQWIGIMLGWAAVMFLLPLQHPFIQLVGLRGNAFLVPCLLLGSRLRDNDGRDLAVALACLNLVAFAFGVGEFFLGVPQFFPQNQVTDIIYKSKDLVNYTAYRIPSTFSNAHSYAGTMVMTIPWLVGAWVQPSCSGWRRWLLMAGTSAALIGIFMAGARTFVVHLGILLVATSVLAFMGYAARLSETMWIPWTLMLFFVGYMVSSTERLQRFFNLADTENVVERVQGSVNMNFLDLLLTYPMSNGLGGGGTSIPFFLQHLITDPVIMENEYSRILLEQGVIGLILWISFIVWIATRRAPPRRHPWSLGWRLLWVSSLASFGLALLGTGMMTSIPQTSLLFLGLGFLAVPRAAMQPKGRARPKAAIPLRKVQKTAAAARVYS